MFLHHRAKKNNDKEHYHNKIGVNCDCFLVCSQMSQGVSAIIGPASSVNVKASYPMTMGFHVPMISPGATDPMLESSTYRYTGNSTIDLCNLRTMTHTTRAFTAFQFDLLLDCKYFITLSIRIVDIDWKCIVTLSMHHFQSITPKWHWGQIHLVLRTLPESCFPVLFHFSVDSSYRYLLRMLPPDSKQSEALVEFIRYFRWDTMVLLTDNTDYGRKTFNSLSVMMILLCLKIKTQKCNTMQYNVRKRDNTWPFSTETACCEYISKELIDRISSSVETAHFTK